MQVQCPHAPFQSSLQDKIIIFASKIFWIDAPIIDNNHYSLHYPPSRCTRILSKHKSGKRITYPYLSLYVKMPLEVLYGVLYFDVTFQCTHPHKELHSLSLAFPCQSHSCGCDTCWPTDVIRVERNTRAF